MVQMVSKRCKGHFVLVLSVAVGASGVIAVYEGGAHAASLTCSAICMAARGGVTELLNVQNAAADMCRVVQFTRGERAPRVRRQAASTKYNGLVDEKG